MLTYWNSIEEIDRNLAVVNVVGGLRVCFSCLTLLMDSRVITLEVNSRLCDIFFKQNSSESRTFWNKFLFFNMRTIRWNGILRWRKAGRVNYLLPSGGERLAPSLSSHCASKAARKDKANLTTKKISRLIAQENIISRNPWLIEKILRKLLIVKDCKSLSNSSGRFHGTAKMNTMSMLRNYDVVAYWRKRCGSYGRVNHRSGDYPMPNNYEVCYYHSWGILVLVFTLLSVRG